jgi:hypothetical protein
MSVLTVRSIFLKFTRLMKAVGPSCTYGFAIASSANELEIIPISEVKNNVVFLIRSRQICQFCLHDSARLPRSKYGGLLLQIKYVLFFAAKLIVRLQIIITRVVDLPLKDQSLPVSAMMMLGTDRHALAESYRARGWPSPPTISGGERPCTSSSPHNFPRARILTQ